jgi:hypothetical protein
MIRQRSRFVVRSAENQTRAKQVTASGRRQMTLTLTERPGDAVRRKTVRPDARLTRGANRRQPSRDEAVFALLLMGACPPTLAAVIDILT